MKRFFILILILLLTSPFANVFANEEVEKLNAQINQYESKLEQIEKEIQIQKEKLNSASNRSKTLSSTVSQLESTKRKLESDISYTQTQIARTELTLSRLEIEINEKERMIRKNSDALGESIRRMNELENTTLVEKFLGYADMSDFWNEVDQTEKIQKTLHTEVEEFLALYDELKNKELENLNQKNALASQKVTLASEKESVQYTQKEKEQLLAATKNEEATYQQILNQKMAQRDAFLDELLEIESKLQYLIDPESYPEPRHGIISWPVDNVIITQHFGGSAFAKTNPHIYGRAFHPGTDFGVPIGTKIKSVSPGIVKATGNTDAFPGCNAWGKWVLVEHNNGLSSLYAHLSSIIVSPGQSVSEGQTIALSGNTGISTGPHLHLTLYASQGVKVGRYSDFKSGSGCAATGATGPFADLDAYLDPYEYLPIL
jgi:murein DD-endopeptidase MepM/ murein hydrolase activator NlpD